MKARLQLIPLNPQFGYQTLQSGQLNLSLRCSFPDLYPVIESELTPN